MITVIEITETKGSSETRVYSVPIRA